MVKFFQLVLILIGFSSERYSAYPIGFLPGIGDTCSNLQRSVIAAISKENINQTFCIDAYSGWNIFKPALQREVESICNQLESQSGSLNLEFGFIMVGISEGGLKARAILETCSMGKYMNKLISIGGPQNGVAGIPHSQNGFWSNQLNGIVDKLVYTWVAQGLIEPAGYYHRIDDEGEYFKGGTPLALYNNISNKNKKIKERVRNLKALVQVSFSKDTMILPKETAHFGFYKASDKKEIVSLKDSKMYQEDWIGLKKLDGYGRLYLYEWDGEHLEFDMGDLRRDIFQFF